MEAQQSVLTGLSVPGGPEDVEAGMSGLCGQGEQATRPGFQQRSQGEVDRSCRQAANGDSVQRHISPLGAAENATAVVLEVEKPVPQQQPVWGGTREHGFWPGQVLHGRP